MADILGTTFSVGNGLSQSSESNTDLLISAFRRTKQPQLDSLTSKKNALSSRQVFLNSLRSRLDNVNVKAADFKTENATDKFAAKKTTSSDASIITASSTTNANVGNVSIKVEQLASADSLVTKRLNRTEVFLFAGSTQLFAIGGKEYTVDFSPEDDNESALAKISSAINADGESAVSAIVIRDTSSTARLSLTAKKSGEENQIVFEDGNVLAALGITVDGLNPDSDSRTTLTTTEAGYQKADKSSLDAKLTVNGVAVARSSNTIDDLLSGVTLNILNVQKAEDAPLTLTTETDSDGVIASVIQPLLDNFNEVLRFINQNASQTRGDAALQALRTRLRGIVGEKVTSAGAGNPEFLSEIGVKIGTDGQLNIGDKTKIKDLLSSNPEKVANLFVGSDSISAKIENIVSGFLGDAGLLGSRAKDLGSQIRTIDSRYKSTEERIDREVESLRKEYTALQRAFLTAQSQYASFASFL